MKAFEPAEYGDRLGPEYDRLYPESGIETDAAVEFLAGLASDDARPSVLEFGIGTGRLAIRLHDRGLRVAGIEASPRMVAALRQKAPGARIEIVQGDFTTTRVEGVFSVVAVVFNAVLDERGVPAQLALFENAARHLAPGGKLVVEAFVLPEHARTGRWTVEPRYVGEEHVELELARFEMETGTVERRLVHLLPEGMRFVSVRDGYAGPDALDVMAQVSGLTRVARYASWTRAPFTSQSRWHVTVYERR